MEDFYRNLLLILFTLSLVICNQIEVKAIYNSDRNILIYEGKIFELHINKNFTSLKNGKNYSIIYE